MKKILSTVLIGSALVAGSLSSAFAVNSQALLAKHGSTAKNSAPKVQLIGVYKRQNQSIDFTKAAVLKWADGQRGRLNLRSGDVSNLLKMMKVRNNQTNFDAPIALTVKALDGSKSFDVTCNGATLGPRGISCLKAKIIKGNKDSQALDGKQVAVMLHKKSGPSGPRQQRGRR